MRHYNIRTVVSTHNKHDCDIIMEICRLVVEAQGAVASYPVSGHSSSSSFLEPGYEAKGVAT